MTGTTAGHVDYGDPRTYSSGPPHEQWDRLRADSPVHRVWSASLDRDLWLVLGWPEVRHVFGHADVFASCYGNDVTYCPTSPDPAGNRMMIVSDGADHHQLRASLQPFFTQRASRAFEQSLAEFTGQVLRGHLDGAPFDFAQEVAWRTPLLAICRVLGVSDSDQERLGWLVNHLLTGHGPDLDVGQKQPARSAAITQLIEYFRDMVNDRTGAAGSELLGALRAATRGVGLSASDLALNLYSLLVAATETTQLAAAGALVAFAENPDQFAVLRHDRRVLRTAVEEVLRWSTPVMTLARTTTVPTTLAGRVIPAGATVAAVVGAANRDPAVFLEPHRFDVTRNPNQHLTFGNSAHFCLGSALARTELKVLLQFLANEVRSVELIGEPRFTYSNAFSGYTTVPLRLVGPESGAT